MLCKFRKPFTRVVAHFNRILLVNFTIKFQGKFHVVKIPWHWQSDMGLISHSAISAVQFGASY